MQIVHDSQARRFVAELATGTAILAYAPAGEGLLELYSTYVPMSGRGKGVAGQLVEAALEYARAEGLRVIPTCWYVGQWIDQHPEHKDLVAA